MAHLCRNLQTRPSPTQEEIAALAYRYWEARGRVDGGALEDWMRAERELCRPAAGTAPSRVVGRASGVAGRR
jgi:hypothetical protein